MRKKTATHTQTLEHWILYKTTYSITIGHFTRQYHITHLLDTLQDYTQHQGRKNYITLGTHRSESVSDSQTQTQREHLEYTQNTQRVDIQKSGHLQSLEETFANLKT